MMKKTDYHDYQVVINVTQDELTKRFISGVAIEHKDGNRTVIHIQGVDFPDEDMAIRVSASYTIHEAKFIHDMAVYSHQQFQKMEKTGEKNRGIVINEP